MAKSGLYARSIFVRPLPDPTLVSAKQKRSVNDTYGVDISVVVRQEGVQTTQTVSTKDQLETYFW